MIKQKNKIFIILGLLLAISLIIVATFFDLKISQSLYNRDSNFGWFLDLFAKLPPFILLALSGSILFAHFARRQGVGNIVVAILISILTFVFWYIICHIFVFDIFYFSSIIFIGCLATILTISGLMITLAVKFETIDKLFHIAVGIILVIVITALATDAIKLIWGRIRFRNLESDFSNFSNWYEIYLFRSGKSFVSGHTSSVTALFSLAYLSKAFPGLKPMNWLIIVASFIFTMLTALSRIVIGAHYLSDVVFGLLVALLVIFVVYKLFITKKYNKVSAKQIKEKTNEATTKEETTATKEEAK